jgi:hypothetical protein
VIVPENDGVEWYLVSVFFFFFYRSEISPSSESFLVEFRGIGMKYRAFGTG